MRTAWHVRALLLAAGLATLAACGPSSEEVERLVDEQIAEALTAVPTPTPTTFPPTPTPTPVPPTPTPTTFPPTPTPTPGPPTPTPTTRPRPFAGANRPHCQAPGTYQDIFTDQTEYYRAIYEREKGIQTGALSPHKQFLADQWQRVVTAYEIDQALNRLSGADPLPFPEYLQERAGIAVTRFDEGQFDALLALSPTEQRAVFERAPDYAFCNVVTTRLSVAGSLGERVLQRIAGPAARRAYDLTPRALAGDDTFLNYLARKYFGF